MNRAAKLLSTVSVVALLVSGAAASAEAADYSAPAFFAPPATNWTGWYAGFHTGWGEASPDFTKINSGDTSAYGNITDQDGWLLGVHVGYNRQLNERYVIGFEADATVTPDMAEWGRAASSTTTSAFHGDVDFLGSLRGRFGVLVHPETLVSGSLGIAYIESEQIVHAGHGTPSARNIAAHEWGGVVGLGVEHLLHEDVSVRAGVSYYFFGDESMADPSSDGMGTLDLDVVTVDLGMSYHF